jgi:hypothetical protein
VVVIGAIAVRDGHWVLGGAVAVVVVLLVAVLDLMRRKPAEQ